MAKGNTPQRFNFIVKLAWLKDSKCKKYSQADNSICIIIPTGQVLWMILTSDLSFYKIVVVTWYTLNTSLRQSEKRVIHFMPEFPNLSTCAWLGNLH